MEHKSDSNDVEILTQASFTISMNEKSHETTDLLVGKLI